MKLEFDSIDELKAFLALLGEQSHIDILQQLLTQGDKIMSAISDFAAKQNAHNDAIDAAVTGISGDIQGLKDQITALQNSPGPISPEDQATLDAMEARTAGIADKLAALDALTPPVVPATPAP